MLLAGPVQAEEIVLKSGLTIQGQIFERTEEWIKVKASGVDMLYYLNEITSIDGKAVGVSDSPAKLAAQPSVSGHNVEPPSAVTVSSKSLEGAIKETITGSPALKTLENDQPSVRMATGESVKTANKMKPHEVVIILCVMLFLVAMAAILFCYPVFLIAKKTGTQYPFFAFIPILNLYLLCKISGRPVWWIIPYLLPFVNLIIDVLVWMSISRIRQKPEWLGIISVVPILNLCMIWYVALSDETWG